LFDRGHLARVAVESLGDQLHRVAGPNEVFARVEVALKVRVNRFAPRLPVDLAVNRIVSIRSIGGRSSFVRPRRSRPVATGGSFTVAVWVFIE
jgi:hypothetical protein